ncbi:retrovirus-related pol polyprotein from transposon TNT 1-94 [Tanacetum coccineum]
MSGTIPPIPPPLGINSGNTGSLSRVDMMPTTNETINTTTTTNVAQNVVDENLPPLLDSKGGSHVTNVLKFDKEDFTSWKMKWTHAEARLTNQDKRLKSIIISCLPNDVMKVVIKCKTANAIWNDLILAHGGPSDTKDTNITALRLKFDAFKALEGEKEPLSPLPKLIGAEPAGTLNSLISLVDLTLNMANLTLKTTVLKKANQTSNKVSPAHVVKKKTKTNPPCVPKTCFYKKVDSSAEQLLLTLMEEEYLKWSIWYLDSDCSRHMRGVKQYLHRYSKESYPKVVFRYNSSRNTEGYGLVNYNGITFTRVAYVNGLKHNLINISQLCDANFKVENLNEVRVKELRSDNGIEFRNHKLKEFYDEKGISQNFSSPCTSKQNGVAKRRNKTLIEAAITMLNSAKLLKQLWKEAVNTACYTQNRSIIVKRHGKTAYDVFRGRSPDISYFHVFSTKGDAINFNGNRSFLDDKFLEPRSKVTQYTRNIDYFPYIHVYDPLPTINTTIPKNNITPTNSPILQGLVSPKEPPEFTSADAHPAPDVLDHPESANNLKPAKMQGIVISKPINEVQITPTIISSSNEGILHPLFPQDRWSRENHIELVNIIGEPLADITTRIRIKDSKADSAHECLYVNFLSKMEPKKLIKALEEEG